MKDFIKKNISWFIVGIMAIVILLLVFKCGNDCPEGTTTSDTIILSGDPYPVYDTIEKPVPYQTIVPVDTFWKDVDTATILLRCRELYKDYYSKRIYNDTLKDDTSALITLIDTVYQNQLQSRILGFQNRRATMIINNTTINGEIPRNKLYLGAGIGTSSIKKISLVDMQLSAKCLLVLKKRWAYGVSIDFPVNDFGNPGFEVSAYYKLSFKKQK